MGVGPCPEPRQLRLALPFRLTACQLFHLALFRSARVIARLLRFFRLHLFAGGALGFLAFFFSQLRCVCHECVWFPLLFKFRILLCRLMPSPAVRTAPPASSNRSEGIVP